MGRNTGRDKVAYSRISPDPAKAGPTLGVVVVVVVVVVLRIIRASHQSIGVLLDCSSKRTLVMLRR